MTFHATHQAVEVHICMTERDARALWRVYGHKKTGVAIIAVPYPDELQHVEIPTTAKVFAWPPNQVCKPFWGPAINEKN
jgi:hypothetical protein